MLLQMDAANDMTKLQSLQGQLTISFSFYIVFWRSNFRLSLVKVILGSPGKPKPKNSNAFKSLELTSSFNGNQYET